MPTNLSLSSMPSLLPRIFGLLALSGSFCCFRWMVTVWHWVENNGHTEGSPAGLGIFAIGGGIDLVLFAIGAMLAVFGFLGLFFPRKKLTGHKKCGE